MLLALDLSALIKAGQFFLSFSILVILHELGHFIPALIFKCRIEKFFLFFDPGFSLWKTKKGDTEYGIGWLPMGGYVKISGMVDESMDKEQLKNPPQPYEFRSKPAWQRLIIMVGGVVVNVVLALVIFIGITLKWGDTMLPAKNLKYGICTDSLGRKIGLKDGDKPLSLDNKPIESIHSVNADIILKDIKTLQVERQGQIINIQLPHDLGNSLNKESQNNSEMFGIRYPTIVNEVGKDVVLVKGKIMPEDTLIAINKKPFKYYNEFVALKKQYRDSIVDITVLRGNDTATFRCLLKRGMVGFQQVDPYKILGTVQINYSLFEAIPEGTSKCFGTLGNYLGALKQLFVGKANVNDSLGGIISIGKAFPAEWDWERFWTLTGIFSIILAFMNILPIPALDGGHALFLLIEIIIGKKPNDKFMEYAQMFGMILIGGVMIYALGLDIWRLFK